MCTLCGGAYAVAGPQEAVTITTLAAKHAVLCGGGGGELVVGVDLAGNEHAHPPELFVEAGTPPSRATPYLCCSVPS